MRRGYKRYTVFACIAVTSVTLYLLALCGCSGSGSTERFVKRWWHGEARVAVGDKRVGTCSSRGWRARTTDLLVVNNLYGLGTIRAHADEVTDP